jgi:hypothetical protein
MRRNVSESLEASHLELLRRTSTYGDLDAWTAFQHSLEETVLTWLHKHPGSKAACHVQSEQYFVAQAFERLWQATIRGQVTCESLSEVLMFLRASLNGAILETLRVFSQPGVDSKLWLVGQDRLEGSAIWNRLLSQLPNLREQRLAYLLYHCGLEPAEIVRYCPQEWSDVQKVICLRRTIFMQFMKGLICEGETFV